MKPIIAQDQARLGLARCVRLAVSGMSYRLLRSGITTAILALAVAFLVHVLTHAILAERVQRSAWDALEPTRIASESLTRLTAVDSAATVLNRLSANEPSALTEAQRWSGMTDKEWRELRHAAKAWRQTRDWFEELTPTESAVLLGGQTFSDWLDSMQGPAEPKVFYERLEQLQRSRSWILHASNAGDITLTRWPMLIEAIQAIRRGHADAVDKIKQADPRPALSAWAENPDGFATSLSDAGFVVSPHARRALEIYARDQQLIAEVQTALQDKTINSQVFAEIGTADLPAVMRALSEDRLPASWDQLVGLRVDQDDLRTAASWAVWQRRFAQVTENYEPLDRNTPFGLPVGTLWLVGLSLLVCVVGVTNALLMSVTERFNEIATMKCLGAMDRSIMQMFVAEAVIQGVLGGTVGVVLGLLLTMMRGFAEFGTLVGRGLEDWPQLLAAAALSLGLGVLLAALAAIGPSWVASRLAPMEAMRVE